LARVLAIVAVILFVIAAGIGLVAFLVYGTVGDPPRSGTVEGLSASTSIDWYEGGMVGIRASGTNDMAAALGYVHGVNHTWTITLWRQAARGRLAEWFGDAALDLDAFTRDLAIADGATAATDGLSDQDRAWLDAYAAGVNAAFQTRVASRHDEIVVFGIELEPWEAAHSIMIERLMAWLSAPLPGAPVGATEELAGFLRTGSVFRNAMHLFGFEQSALWTVRDTAATIFHQRHVYGDNALPFLQEVHWQDDGGAGLVGATLPGTPYFLSGARDGAAWALILRARSALSSVVLDPAETEVIHHRLLSRDSREHLRTRTRLNGAVAFQGEMRAPTPPPPLPADTLQGAPPETVAPPTDAPAPTVPPPGGDPARTDVPPPASPGDAPDEPYVAPVDSSWTLWWSGIDHGTDASSWRAMLEGGQASFSLFEGDGMRVSAAGDAQVLGSPLHVVSFGRGVLVTNDPMTAALGATLATLRIGDESAPGEEIWYLSTHSAWAEQVMPGMIAAIDSVGRRGPNIDQALPYLLNWDYRFDRASIAASIFDVWVREFHRATGELPTGELPATLSPIHYTYFQSLDAAVRALGLGEAVEASSHRWEVVMAEVRYFPFWDEAYATGRHARTLARTRFAPIMLGGRGHPTSVFWSPSFKGMGRPAHAGRAAWFEVGDGNRTAFQRRWIDQQSFLARHLTSDGPPEPVFLPAEAPRRTTTLSSR
jgi:penicillin G amidase